MRHSLRDAELPPPAEGWARLQRELGEQTPAPETPARPRWRILWPQVAAAAAAVLVCVVAGGLLLRQGRDLVREGDVIASAADTQTTAAPMPQQSDDTKSLSKTLAEAVGLSQEPSGAPPSSMRPQRLLAAATPAGRDAEPPAARKSPASLQSAGERGGTASAKLLAAPAHDAAADPACVTAQSARNDARSDARSDARNDAPAAEGADAAMRRAVAAAASSAQRPARSRGAFDEAPSDARTRSLRRTSFALHAGGSLSGGAAGNSSLPSLLMSAPNAISERIGTGHNLTSVQRYNAGDNTYRHHQPLSFGFSVARDFSHGLSLESGVIYTLVRSDVQTRYSSEDVSQKLHFIGIPLRVNWRFLERGRFSLYVGAGGMAEKCVSAKFGSTAVNEPSLQWSALAAVGAQYRLGDFVGLYFEPEGSYYFTETRLRSVRTDSPLTLSLRLGVRLSF